MDKGEKYDYDVVIIGYGPTGLASASLLARLGHKVAVYERWPTLYGLPRLIGFDAESARMLQAAGDVPVGMRESYPIRRYRTVDKDMDQLLSIEWPDDHVAGYPIKTATYQPYIEDSMDEAARDRGARINTGWKVTGLVQDEAGVNVTAEPWSKEEVGENLKPALSRTVRAKYVIGSDGARSMTRQLLGVENEDLGYHDAWLSIDIERRAVLPAEFMYGTSWQIAEAGNVWVVVPAGTKRMRFELQVDPEGDHTDLLNPDYAHQLLEERFGLTREHLEIVRLTIYPFGSTLARNWRVGRVFLAGDAAHLMAPFLGEGAASGMRDATTLAWKLDLVLRGLCTPDFLDTYQEERYDHVKAFILASAEIGRVVTERDPEVAAAQNAALKAGAVPPPPSDPTLTSGVLMRASDGSLPPLVGGLAPQGWVHLEGRTGRFDDVVGWGFHLVVRNVDPSSLLGADQLAFLDSIHGLAIGTGVEAGPGIAKDITWAYERYFEQNGIAAFLMRPDFYVYGVATTLDQVGSLVDSLQQQLGLDGSADLVDAGQPASTA